MKGLKLIYGIQLGGVFNSHDHVTDPNYALSNMTYKGHPMIIVNHQYPKGVHVLNGGAGPCQGSPDDKHKKGLKKKKISKYNIESLFKGDNANGEKKQKDDGTHEGKEGDKEPENLDIGWLFSEEQNGKEMAQDVGMRLDQVLRSKSKDGNLPWKWWQQCYNDNVLSCSSKYGAIKGRIKSQPFELANEIRKRLSGSEAKERSYRYLETILVGELKPPTDSKVPVLLYKALEVLLGMGFRPSLTEETNLHEWKLNLSPVINRLATDLKYIVKLGYHRLVVAYLDLQGIRPYSTEDDLLTAANEQPFVLAELLKRVIGDKDHLLKSCTNCNVLALSIRKSTTINVGTISPLCTSAGQHPIQVVKTKWLDVMATTMKPRDRVMLARALLYLVFDVPMNLTICPNCSSLPSTKLSHLINAMLQCYCTPHSRFHVLN